MLLTGEKADTIHDWRGLTLDQCKNLAASTDRGQFWTYKEAVGGCTVTITATKVSAPGSGVISGSGKCGTPMPLDGNAFII